MLLLLLLSATENCPKASHINLFFVITGNAVRTMESAFLICLFALTLNRRAPGPSFCGLWLYTFFGLLMV
jgi:hypothetical protein